jgi:hypothetical protein
MRGPFPPLTDIEPWRAYSSLLRSSSPHHASAGGSRRWQWKDLKDAAHIAKPLIANEDFFGESVGHDAEIRDIVISNIVSATFEEDV